MIALVAIFLSPIVAGGAAAALIGAVIADARVVRKDAAVTRTSPQIVSRGVPARFAIGVSTTRAASVRVRQPTPANLTLDVAERDGSIETSLTAQRRGRHILPPVATRAVGPLRLGSWISSHAGEEEVLVYPDLPAARRLALAVREGRMREAGQRAGGPLGLGTEFESIRDYLPDDDIRQVNWQATSRLGRPMSNQYRIEQDRDVICVIDSGRLMGAPIGDQTRLDAAVDAATALCAVGDEVGDRTGLIAFDTNIRRRLSPRRAAARAVTRALFDLEPTDLDSDYELAFREVRNVKRAFVVVLTDLLEEAAARPLLDAVPLLARRHHVVVATVEDVDLRTATTAPPQTQHDVFAATVALEVLTARARVAQSLRHRGAEVVEAPPEHLGARCVSAYLRAKRHGRL